MSCEDGKTRFEESRMFPMPNVRTEVRDTRTGGTYVIWAYRKLEQTETVEIIRGALASGEIKRPRRGRLIKLSWFGDEPGQGIR